MNMRKELKKDHEFEVEVDIRDFPIEGIIGHLVDSGYTVETADGENLSDLDGDRTITVWDSQIVNFEDCYDHIADILDDLEDQDIIEELELRGYAVQEKSDNRIGFDENESTFSKDECKFILDNIPEVQGDTDRRRLLEKVRRIYYGNI
jgi:hypothetical protein